MKRLLLIALCAVGAASLARAQDTLPNLIGEWTGTS
jgi:hypothetical protein